MKKIDSTKKNHPRFPHVIATEQMATINMSSPFRNVSVGFNWINVDYPALHEHSHWELFFVVEGTVLHTINDEEYIMKAGDACLIKPMDKHSLRLVKNDANFQHINFFFTEEVARTFLSAHLNFETIVKKRQPTYFSLTHEHLQYFCEKLMLIQNLNKTDFEKRSKLLLNHLFLILSEQELLNNNHYPNWLNEFLESLSSPISFSKNVEELAKTTPYGYSRLAHLVKEYTGTSIIDFIKNAKMTYAKRLLRTTDLPIANISQTLCYYSVSTFTHTFKKAFKQTPLQYRKNHTKIIE